MPSAIEDASEDLQQHSVVVVDDNASTLYTIREVLDRRNLSVTTFQDPVMALEYIRETPPDLILVDLIMPGFDGFDLCQACQANTNTSQIPIVMLTGDAFQENVTRARQLGIKDFIVKPFRPKALGDKVLQILGELETGE